MTDKYFEQLKTRFDEAVENLEKVKKEVADEVLKMTAHTATHFGGAYASHIDHLTLAGAKVQLYGEQIRIYEHYKTGNID